MEWKRKPRVLLVGDSSVIHTGFAKVVKHIATYLYDTDNYDVETIGWFHRPSEEIVPYKIHPTKIDNAQVAEHDKYAIETYPDVVEKFKPDLVLAVGDSWMVDHIADHREKIGGYKLLLYVPIDGMPIPKEWTKSFEKADTLVAYGSFGMKVIKARNASLDNMTAINHGVDIEMFKPGTEESSKALKKQLGGEDLFLIGCVARNQPRKNLPRLFKTFSLFLKPWTTCEDCENTVFEKVDKCQFCESENLFHGDAKEDVRLYLHMALKDCGWNIYELIERFDLRGRVAYPKGLQIGSGVSVEKLAEIMGAFDVFTLPTSGEGWGLPILESMSCGLPTVVTDYSAHTEFCHGAADLIAVSEYVTEPMTNIERALVDIFDYCMRLDKLYYDDKAVFFKKWKSFLEANGMSLNEDNVTVGKEWREKLGKEARLRAMNYSWERIYEEWEYLVNKSLDYEPENCSIEEKKIEYEMEEL